MPVEGIFQALQRLATIFHRLDELTEVQAELAKFKTEVGCIPKLLVIFWTAVASEARHRFGPTSLARRDTPAAPARAIPKRRRRYALAAHSIFVRRFHFHQQLRDARTEVERAELLLTKRPPSRRELTE